MFGSIAFVSLLAASVSSTPTAKVDNFAGWDCHYESLAQSFDERAGRANAQGGAVRVCTPPKATVKASGKIISVRVGGGK